MADQAEALMSEAEELRSRLEMVSRQLDMLNDLKQDKARAHETLVGAKGRAPGDEILFPIGGNTFVAATLGDIKTVLKGIGADYAMQRPVDQAIEELKGELDTVESDIQALSQSAAQLEARYNQIAETLQSFGAAPQTQ